MTSQPDHFPKWIASMFGHAIIHPDVAITERPPGRLVSPTRCTCGWEQTEGETFYDYYDGWQNHVIYAVAKSRIDVEAGV